MSAGWTNAATKALLAIWGDVDIQSKLDAVHRNKDIYEKVSDSLRELDFNFDWKQCRTKVKNLTSQYRKAKDENRKSGNRRSGCPFYDELDGILGNRAASDPPVLVESCRSPGHTEEQEVDLLLDSPQASAPRPVETPTQRDPSSLVNDTEASSEQTPQTSRSVEAPCSSSRLQRKRSSNRKGAASEDSDDLFLKLAKLEEMAQKREDGREERRMVLEAKLEDERRAREHQHELKMMETLLKFIGPQHHNHHAFPSYFQPDVPPMRYDPSSNSDYNFSPPQNE